MLKRTLVGVGLLAVLFTCLFYLRQFSSIVVDAIILIFLCVGTYEIYKAFKSAQHNAIGAALIVSCLVIYPCTYFLAETGILLALAAGIITALIVFTFSHKYKLTDLAVTAFILFYPIALTSLFFMINGGKGEILAILLVIMVAVMTDTMAYFAGSLFGKRKLCPEISPKKTIAGAVGGLVGGMLGSVIVFLLFDYFRLFDSFGSLKTFSMFADGNYLASLGVYLTIGLVGGLLAEVGDLAASWIKRNANIKDFGKIFPGHGGVIDRLDSIMFVLPVVYFAFSIIGYLGL